MSAVREEDDFGLYTLETRSSTVSIDPPKQQQQQQQPVPAAIVGAGMTDVMSELIGFFSSYSLITITIICMLQ